MIRRMTAGTIRTMSASTPRVTVTQRERAHRLLTLLQAHYPDAHCELNFASPRELLIATILSAQATDVSVNKATPALFARFPTPHDYVRSSPAEIEPYIRTIGLFRGKAKSIHLSMSRICEDFGGEVPATMDQLLTLRGVARKTANVVLGNCFGINEGFVVDTHVERLAKRLALAPRDANVLKVEQILMKLFPQELWCDISHMLIFHGRRACPARAKCCGSHAICMEFGVRCDLPRSGC